MEGELWMIGLGDDLILTFTQFFILSYIGKVFHGLIHTECYDCVCRMHLTECRLILTVLLIDN